MPALRLTRRAFLASVAASPALRSVPRSAQDEAFLEELSHRAFQFFWEHSNSGTGLTLDRARNDGSVEPRLPTMASIAATGFGLSALAIGAERKWVRRAE